MELAFKYNLILKRKYFSQKFYFIYRIMLAIKNKAVQYFKIRRWIFFIKTLFSAAYVLNIFIISLTET